MCCTNYLDDYLMVAPNAHDCNYLVRKFVSIAEQIGLEVAREKTVWASTRVTFLGILLVGDKAVLSIPEDKRNKALQMSKL